MDTREWTSATTDVLKFARKVQAEWDDEGSLFRPCAEYRKDEEWVIHWLKADKFVELACFDETGLALKLHIEKLKKMVLGGKLLVIMEGLSQLLARAKNARNRARAAAALRHMGHQTGPRKGDDLRNLNVDDVENVLIEMQLVYEIRVVHTSCTADSAEWISILATDIASIPYRYVLFMWV